MVRLLGLIGMLPEVDPSTWDHREVRMLLLLVIRLLPYPLTPSTDIPFFRYHYHLGGTLWSR